MRGEGVKKRMFRAVELNQRGGVGKLSIRKRVKTLISTKSIEVRQSEREGEEGKAVCKKM